MSVTYRPDIDGLRAIAVIPVVLFHARIAGFDGGFVGVDVFFVISGFLITSLIKQEIDDGTFSYLSFWERRARRLLPPLILVVAVTCIAAYQFFLPEDLKALGQSVVAISGFASNIYFWLKTGYFEAPAETVPLLHTWTLAVEEQFYLLFPAVLVGVSTWKRPRRIAVVVLIGVASFGLSVSWVELWPSSAYYLLPSRAWELMLGAALALTMTPKKTTPSAISADIFLVLGLGLIAVAVYVYKETTPFPGVAALLPCAGTALIIWFGDQNRSLVRRVLDNGPMVFFGKLSYSIYLWHWPLLVLYGTWSSKSLASLTSHEVTLIMSATVLLSWMSLTLIENPIRRRKAFAAPRAIFLATGSAVVVIGAFGLTAHFWGGFESRVPSEILRIANGARDWAPESRNCGDPSASHVRTEELCRIGSDSSRASGPRFFLWGDSHSQALIPVVDQVAREFGIQGVTASHGGCPPLYGVNVLGNEWALGCRSFNDDMFERISNGSFDAVFLNAIWSAYTREGNLRYADGSGNASDAERILEQHLRETIDRLTAQGITVFIVEEVPYSLDYRPSRFALGVWRGADPNSAGISMADYLERNQRFFGLLDGLNIPKLKRISPADALCRDGTFCPAITDGRSNFIDQTHVSTHGAGQLAPLFRSAFREVEWR